MSRQKPVRWSICLVGTLAFAFLSCNPQNQAQQPASTAPKASTNSNAETLLQGKDDLLAGVFQAVCYSGFRAGQHPDRGDGAKNPTREQILEDLTILSRDSNFTLIRIYDSGENSETVLKAISENKLPIKVMLGIWLKAELSNHETCAWLTEPIPAETLEKNKLLNQEEISRGIALANAYPEIVVAVNVGNEALVDWNDHKVATESIIGYVKQVKTAIAQPVTVAENYKWWADHGKELADVCDFVSVHTYPAWEGKGIDEGMSFTLENLNEVRRSLPDCKMVISEAGWASVASEFGQRASEENQQRYFGELMSWAAQNNVTTFFFEAFDEPWKGDPNNAMGAEKHWGLFTVDRKAKRVMQDKYPDLK
jgi:exo-beta-1,3-glucanase (GH17 family)